MYHCVEQKDLKMDGKIDMVDQHNTRTVRKHVLVLFNCVFVWQNKVHLIKEETNNPVKSVLFRNVLNWNLSRLLLFIIMILIDTPIQMCSFINLASVRLPITLACKMNFHL